jgi:hypothetical protein
MPDLNTRLHKLAEDCVAAFYRFTDVDAAASLLVVASELLHITAHGEAGEVTHPVPQGKDPTGAVAATLQ